MMSEFFERIGLNADEFYEMVWKRLEQTENRFAAFEESLMSYLAGMVEEMNGALGSLAGDITQEVLTGLLSEIPGGTFISKFFSTAAKRYVRMNITPYHGYNY